MASKQASPTDPFAFKASRGTFELTALGNNNARGSSSTKGKRTSSSTRRRSMHPKNAPSFEDDGGNSSDSSDGGYHPDSFRPTVFNVNFPGYGDIGTYKETTRKGPPATNTPPSVAFSSRSTSLAGDPRSEADAGPPQARSLDAVYIRESDQIAMDASAIQFAIRHIVRHESVNFQVKFTPPVEKLTSTPEFENLVKGFIWIGIFSLKTRWYPGHSDTWKEDEQSLFHSMAVCYGKLFESVELEHNDNPVQFIEHRDSCMSPMPVLVAKASYYMISSFFGMVEDDGRIDAKLRNTLITQCYSWMSGIVPQRLDLKGWVRKEYQRKVKKKRKDFNAEALSDKLDHEAQPQARKFAHLSVLSNRMGGTTSAPQTAREKPMAVVDLASVSGPKPPESPATARGPTTPREKGGQNPSATQVDLVKKKNPPKELTPEHTHHKQWYSSGGRLVGHLSTQRSIDGQGKRVVKSLSSFSPLMQEYFSGRRIDAKQQPGGRKEMPWSSLTKMDRQGQRVIFSRSSEQSLKVADRILSQNEANMEALEDSDRRDAVNNQRMRRFWEGKSQYAISQMAKMGSYNSAEAVEERTELHRQLIDALTGRHPDVFDALKACQRALAQARQSLFSIPIKYRTKVHKLTAKVYAKMRALERVLPLMTERKNTLDQFGETINFDHGTVDDLDEIFTGLLDEEEAALDAKFKQSVAHIPRSPRFPPEVSMDATDQFENTGRGFSASVGTRFLMSQSTASDPRITSPRVPQYGRQIMETEEMDEFLTKTLGAGFSVRGGTAELLCGSTAQQVPGGSPRAPPGVGLSPGSEFPVGRNSDIDADDDDEDDDRSECSEAVLRKHRGTTRPFDDDESRGDSADDVVSQLNKQLMKTRVLQMKDDESSLTDLGGDPRRVPPIHLNRPLGSLRSSTADHQYPPPQVAANSRAGRALESITGVPTVQSATPGIRREVGTPRGQQLQPDSVEGDVPAQRLSIHSVSGPSDTMDAPNTSTPSLQTAMVAYHNSKLSTAGGAGCPSAEGGALLSPPLRALGRESRASGSRSSLGDSTRYLALTSQQSFSLSVGKGPSKHKVGFGSMAPRPVSRLTNDDGVRPLDQILPSLSGSSKPQTSNK